LERDFAAGSFFRRALKQRARPDFDGDQAPSTLCQALEARGAGRVVPDQGRRWPHPRLRLFRGRADTPKLLQRLSKDDARRMAQQILRLPELVRIAKGIDPGEA